MTGRSPKIHLLRPEFSLVVTYEFFILLLKKITNTYPKAKQA